MTVLDLSAYKPVPATLGDANQIANGMQAIQNCINALDNNNFAAGKIFDPTKIMQNAAAVGQALVWDGANWSPGAVGGWVVLSALTYGTTDGHTFTATYAGDLTATVPVGARVKLTNQAATQYFIVTAHVAGTLTLYGGTTYSITNTAITNPFFSREKCPVGFPLNPVTWTEELNDAGNRSQVSPSTSTWYAPGSLALTVPIGLWWLEWVAMCESAHNNVITSFKATLSTTTNSETDADFSTYSATQATSFGGAILLDVLSGRRKAISLAAKQTYNLLIETLNASPTSIGFIGSGDAKTIIRAVCAYL